MNHDTPQLSWLFWALLILALIVSMTHAQAANELSLADALDLAEQQNLHLQMLREELNVAGGQITEARAGALPFVNLGAHYSRVDDVPAFGSGAEAMQMGQLDNYKALAEVRQVLYAGGGVKAALRMAREFQAATASRVQYGRAETAFGIHALFNGVLLAREDIKVALEAIELSEQNLFDVRSHYEQGIAKRFDLLRAEEQLSRSRSDLIAASNGLHKARLALLRAVELPLDDPREITGELRFVPAEFNTTNALALALEHREDLAEASRNIHVQREAVAVARSAGRPQVGLFGEIKQANPDRSFQDEWETSWAAGIRADFPVFDGLKTRGRVAQQMARLRQAELQRDNLASQIGLEVSEALADLETSAELVAARRQRVEEANEAMRLARRGYEEGLQPQIDVLDAQLSLSNSRRSYAQAVFEHVMALRRLERATGTLANKEQESNQPKKEGQNS